MATLLFYTYKSYCPCERMKKWPDDAKKALLVWIKQQLTDSLARQAEFYSLGTGFDYNVLLGQ